MAWEDGTPATWGEQYEQAKEQLRLTKHELFARVLGVDDAITKGDDTNTVVVLAHLISELADDLCALAEAAHWAVQNRRVG